MIIRQENESCCHTHKLLNQVYFKGALYDTECVHMDMNDLFMIAFLKNPVYVLEHVNTISCFRNLDKTLSCF